MNVHPQKETDMELEEYKKMWKESQHRIDNLETQNRQILDRMERGEARSSLDKLARYYKSFSIVGCLLFFLLLPFVRMEAEGIIKSALWIMIFGYAEAAVAVTVDIYLYHAIKRINVSLMSVKEVSEQAARCRKIHLMSQCVLIPLAIGFVIAAGMSAPNGSVLFGMIVGGVIGGIIGFRKWLDMMRAYRRIIEDSNDLLS